MRLTKLQHKVLKVWWRYYSDGYSIAQLFRTCWRPWLTLTALGALTYFIMLPAVPSITWLSVGLCAGAILRDFGYYQASRRTWPITREVIDWQRVSDLLESHEKEMT